MKLLSNTYCATKLFVETITNGVNTPHGYGHEVTITVEKPAVTDLDEARTTIRFGNSFTLVLTNEEAALLVAHLGNTLIEKGTLDDLGCPGCGCQPGDGKTKNCTHPDGCGYTY